MWSFLSLPSPLPLRPLVTDPHPMQISMNARSIMEAANTNASTPGAPSTANATPALGCTWTPAPVSVSRLHASHFILARVPRWNTLEHSGVWLLSLCRPDACLPNRLHPRLSRLCRQEGKRRGKRQTHYQISPVENCLHPLRFSSLRRASPRAAVCVHGAHMGRISWTMVRCQAACVEGGSLVSRQTCGCNISSVCWTR